MGAAGKVGRAGVVGRGQPEGAFRLPETVDVGQVAVAPTSEPAQDVAAITIERLILHHLDNRTGEMLLVEAELTLDPSVRRLFTDYIATARQSADWQARFLPDDAAVPALCAQLLRDPAAFVEVSHEMARRLFAQMRLRPNQINPGDFVVATYTAVDMPSACIALFKLDPDAWLVRTFAMERGRRTVRISLADNLMPQSVRRKQKCALITPTADGADFSVVLLDTLANVRSEGVAAYFYRGFLATQILPSARRRTRLFLRATDDWLASHGMALSPHALLHFYDARRTALSGEAVDLSAFALAALPHNGDLAADLLAWLAARVFDAELESDQTRFIVDRATADPIVRYVTLELDGGAQLRIPTERFAEMTRVDDRRVGGKIRLTIETLTLKEGTPQ